MSLPMVTSVVTVGSISVPSVRHARFAGFTSYSVLLCCADGTESGQVRIYNTFLVSHVNILATTANAALLPIARYRLDI